MAEFLLLGVIVVPAVVISVLAYALMRGRKSCPKCGNMLPFVRKPTSPEQALHGGWTCGKCGAELDRNAALISGR